jgi:hypothetical protein
MVAGAAGSPLVGTRVHPRVSAAPSSGSMVVPVALFLALRCNKGSDEHAARRVCLRGAHLSDAGGGDDGTLGLRRPLPFLHPFSVHVSFGSRVRVSTLHCFNLIRDRFLRSFLFPSMIYNLAWL